MHARQLVELAALVSAHGPVLIESARVLPAAGLKQYWSASKCRLDRWSRAIKRLRACLSELPPAGNADPNRPDWPNAFAGAAENGLAPVLAEVLLGEVLTRVWMALLDAYDNCWGCDDAGPVGRSVLMGHLEVRNRALGLLVDWPKANPSEAPALDRLRRHAERWADLLVGHLAVTHPVSRWAPNPPLARQFADDLRVREAWARGSQAWPLALASLRAGFRREAQWPSPNADLNLQIAEAILACFPPDAFGASGLFRQPGKGAPDRGAMRIEARKRFEI